MPILPTVVSGAAGVDFTSGGSAASSFIGGSIGDIAVLIGFSYSDGVFAADNGIGWIQYQGVSNLVPMTTLWEGDLTDLEGGRSGSMGVYATYLLEADPVVAYIGDWSDGTIFNGNMASGAILLDGTVTNTIAMLGSPILAPLGDLVSPEDIVVPEDPAYGSATDFAMYLFAAYASGGGATSISTPTGTTNRGSAVAGDERSRVTTEAGDGGLHPARTSTYADSTAPHAMTQEFGVRVNLSFDFVDDTPPPTPGTEGGRWNPPRRRRKVDFKELPVRIHTGMLGLPGLQGDRDR